MTASNCVISGLTIIGFTGSGISVSQSASGNQIGVDRGIGTGLNSGGLRIAGHGAYGISLDGPGCTGNQVRGCWIGLNAAATAADPNLAGILIEGGANTNFIGDGTLTGRNLVEGNTYEGIVVTGSGSDGNQIIGNVIGGDADSTIGNGSSGIFLSQGTSGTVVGSSGDGTDDQSFANDIQGNGGDGIEIRTSAAVGNSSHANRITGNSQNGIGLYDGSNHGVQPPILTTITVTAVTAARATIQLAGTAAGGGTVEIFNDSGSQGAIFLGRCQVQNGIWGLTVAGDTTKSITATYTDATGDTSVFTALASQASLLQSSSSASSPAVASSSGGSSCGSGALAVLIGMSCTLVGLRRRHYRSRP